MTETQSRSEAASNGSAPGFRRRILITPGSSSVTAELEDDWHRMVVTLEHSQGSIMSVTADMKRWPWTTCPGAIAQLAETFSGVALSVVARRGERLQNCTHLHDLTLFAAAHALDEASVAYDVQVSDPVDGRRHAVLRRNGALELSWVLEGDRFIAPIALAPRRLGEMGDWISGLDLAGQEAARILRWAAILAYGRGMDIPTGVSATTFPGGSCFTFQPERARDATRRAGAHRDFSDPGSAPLADHARLFPAGGGEDSGRLDLVERLSGAGKIE